MCQLPKFSVPPLKKEEVPAKLPTILNRNLQAKPNEASEKIFEKRSKSVYREPEVRKMQLPSDITPSSKMRNTQNGFSSVSRAKQ